VLEKQLSSKADNEQTETPDQTKQVRKAKKKNFVSTLFGF
jgi:hypothetical protein